MTEVHTHCWHMTGMVGAQPAQGIKGKEHSRCCWCDGTQERLYQLVARTDHGTFMPQWRRVFDDGRPALDGGAR